MDFQIVCPLYTGHGWEYLLGALLPAGDESFSQGFFLALWKLQDQACWRRKLWSHLQGSIFEAGCPKQCGLAKQIPFLSPGCTRPYQKLPPSVVIYHLSEWAQASSQRASVLGWLALRCLQEGKKVALCKSLSSKVGKRIPSNARGPNSHLHFIEENNVGSWPPPSMLSAKWPRPMWESDCLGVAHFINSLRRPVGFSAGALVTKLSMAGEGLIWQCVWGRGLSFLPHFTSFCHSGTFPAVTHNHNPGSTSFPEVLYRFFKG